MVGKVWHRLRLYWSLIKSLQTGLLLTTGVVGYLSAGTGGREHLGTLLGVAVSLFLAISGSTVLNMWYDRDIDARMQRTCWRPLPAGKIHPTEALILGLALSAVGVGWGLLLDVWYGLIVFAGVFFDVIVYTVWLKRRTPWSIVWGGLAGGMPVLAGRTLGVGGVDAIGVALAAAILFWIPTHILTFAMRYDKDYRHAGVPTIPARYGFRITYALVAVSSVLAAATMTWSAWQVGVSAGAMRALLVLSAALLLLATTSALRPSNRLNFGLFKYASLYMLSSMVLIAMG